MLDFYCDLYLERFGVNPVRIDKTDRFLVGQREMTIREIRHALWPSAPMTEAAKKTLRQLAERKRAGVKPRRRRKGDKP